MEERVGPRPALRVLEAGPPLLPQDVPSEAAVLGSILLNRDALLAVDDLTPADFYQERHRLIFQAMRDLAAKRIPPDTRTLAAELGRRGELDAIGGVAYLSSLVDGVPTSYHVQHYAEPVRRTARLRRLINAGSQITALGYTADDAEVAAADAQQLLTEATAMTAAADVVSGADAAGESWERFTSEQAPLISTGWRDLDDLIGGLAGGDLSIIGARPSVGKTSWAVSLIRNLCRLGRATPLIFELEMTREQLVHRLVAMESGIETRVLRERRVVSEADMQRIATAHATVGSWRWSVCDLAGQTPQQIRARTFRHIADHPDTVVIIDYLGIMEPDRPRENRVQDVTALSGALKRLAREAHVPVLALCQLSRAVEGRQSHIPILSDLRDSGSVEQDADLVGFLYRPELYDKDTDQRGIAELHIAKHRHGPIGVVPYRFDAATTRFDDLTYRDMEGY